MSTYALEDKLRVTLLRFTPDPEKAVTLAAKLCYSDTGIEGLEKRIEKDTHEKLLREIIRMGHHSVIEHASFTFGIEGVSRATTHQLVRHRLASYSQQSQRYVAFMDHLNYIIPPPIEARPELKRQFVDMVDAIFRLYKGFIEEGIPAEDARYLLPGATETKIIVTMNARELLHFFTLRGCERAQWEIRTLAKRMLSMVKRVAPIIFEKAGPACVRGKCTEGKMTCGRPDEIREEFLRL